MNGGQEWSVVYGFVNTLWTGDSDRSAKQFARETIVAPPSGFRLFGPPVWMGSSLRAAIATRNPMRDTERGLTTSEEINWRLQSGHMNAGVWPATAYPRRGHTLRAIPISVRADCPAGQGWAWNAIVDQ